MTTTYQTADTGAQSRTPLMAALGIGASLIVTAVGTFSDLTGNDSRAESWQEYGVVAAVVVVTAAVVFGLVVRTAAQGNTGRRALALGVVSFLSIAVFWAGLPLVLAAGAIACALTDRDARGGMSGLAKAGVALAAITAAIAAFLAVAG